MLSVASDRSLLPSPRLSRTLPELLGPARSWAAVPPPTLRNVNEMPGWAFTTMVPSLTIETPGAAESMMRERALSIARVASGLVMLSPSATSAEVTVTV